MFYIIDISCHKSVFPVPGKKNSMSKVSELIFDDEYIDYLQIKSEIVGQKVKFVNLGILNNLFQGSCSNWHLNTNAMSQVTNSFLDIFKIN